MKVSSAAFALGAVELSDLPADGLPEVALAGRSNVGKSSLINCLAHRRRLAYTSSTPGKTQQLNYYCLNRRFYLVDLPGYGFVRGGAKLRVQLGHLAETYLEKRQELCAVVQLLDARRGPTELDRLMVAYLRHRGLPFLLVFTKVDKVSGNQLHALLARIEDSGEFAGIPFIPFSAVTGKGRDDLLEWLSQQVEAKIRRARKAKQS